MTQPDRADRGALASGLILIFCGIIIWSPLPLAVTVGSCLVGAVTIGATIFVERRHARRQAWLRAHGLERSSS